MRVRIRARSPLRPDRCDRVRLKRHADGTHDGSVDLLLTGCEVSLWLLEQFASDFSQVCNLFDAVALNFLHAEYKVGVDARQLTSCFCTGFSAAQNPDCVCKQATWTLRTGFSHPCHRPSAARGLGVEQAAKSSIKIETFCV